GFDLVVLRKLQHVLWCLRRHYGALLRAHPRTLNLRRQDASLNRVAAPLARADADHLVDRKDEDLPVTDATGLRRLLDRPDHVRDLLVADDDLELHLRQKI